MRSPGTVMGMLVALLVFAGGIGALAQPTPAAGTATDGASWAGEQALVHAWLEDPACLHRLVEAAPELDPRVRQRLAVRLRFAMVHQPSLDLATPLEALEGGRTSGSQVRPTQPRPGPLTTANLLKIPLRCGRLEVTWLFKKYRGEILICTPTHFAAVLDQYSIDVVPDPANPGKVLAKLLGDPQAPADPVPAAIKSDGTTAQILADDGTTVTVVHTGHGVYKFSSSQLPVTLTARYID